MSFPVERVVAGKLDIGSGADYFKSNGYFVDLVFNIDHDVRRYPEIIIIIQIYL